MTKPVEPKARKVQPLCAACNHPLPFHGLDRKKCRALKCSCKAFVDTPVVEPGVEMRFSNR